MAGRFLAVQFAKVCRIAADVPVYRGQHIIDDIMVYQHFFAHQLPAVYKLVILGARAGDLSVQPEVAGRIV